MATSERTEECPLARTPRELGVIARFGFLAVRDEQARPWPESVRPVAGTVTLVAGPSASGKTQMLAALAASLGQCRPAHLEPFPTDVSVVDAVAPAEPLADALRYLAACGLGEPRHWLRTLEQLSAGEQFRARLARAVSLRGGRRSDSTCPLLCDEFCSGLHRRAARAIAFNLRKLATRERLAVVVATAADDLEADLRPDTVVRLTAGGGCKLEPRGGETVRSSFRDRLRIELGSLRDFAAMAAMHYRHRGHDRIGCVDSVFVIRELGTDELLGVVVYGHSPLELALRNAATKGRYVRNAALLNREMRILRRLIVHPDVRGCGLGHWLVSETLPRVGTRHVECLAAMGLVNPVFEKAGMERIGLCSLPRGTGNVLRELKAMGVDPLSVEFVDDVCRRPRVRQLVARAVFDWYRAGTRDADSRVARQTPPALARTFRQLMDSRPVYYLWSNFPPTGRGGQESRSALRGPHAWGTVERSRFPNPFPRGGTLRNGQDVCSSAGDPRVETT